MKTTYPHTPGPWGVDKLGNDADQYEVYERGKGYTIAVTHNDKEGANACLITAAPELLESLESLVGWDADAIESDPQGFETDVANARDAIAKARGQ